MIVHLLLGDSGAGKTHMFKELSLLPGIGLVDADKVRKNWPALRAKVDEALAARNMPVLSITRGVSTFIKFCPDITFKLYYIDLTPEEIAVNRRLKAGDPEKVVNMESVASRGKRLASIYLKAGANGVVRGSHSMVLEAITASLANS